VVKEELTRKSESTLEEVNELIIRKTLGGPKRFRPLTREELENKIFDLEKKVTASTAASANKRNTNAESKSDTPSVTNNNNNNSTRATTSAVRNSGSNSVRMSVDSGAENTASDIPNKQNGPMSLLNAALLVDEVQNLKATIGAKDSIINAQRDEIVRLRARNGELVKAEEEVSFLERQCQMTEDQNHILMSNLEDLAAKLAESMEVASKYKSEAAMIAECEHSELLTLQQQCEKLLKQNSTLLKNLAEAESALSRYENESNQSKQRSQSAESSVQSKDAKIRALEDKLSKLEDMIQQLESRNSVLDQEGKQVPILKEQLREKNILIKEMKRNMEERDKIMLQRSSSKSIPTVNQLGDGKSGITQKAEEKEMKHPAPDNISSAKSINSPSL
jgi:hypothetical protein